MKGMRLDQTLEEQQFQLRSQCIQKHSKLQADVNKLMEIQRSSNEGSNIHDALDSILHGAVDRQNVAKKELSGKLRKILELKRQLDDVPSKEELIQYERRISELNVHNQAKFQKTRTCYATFNALLEIKELMLKEISLLNSISSQFQGAITSSAGRMKLVDSIEEVFKGILQKLDKAKMTLEAEQKVCDVAKEKYSAALSDRRHCYSWLKAFEEECTKKVKLQAKLQE